MNIDQIVSSAINDGVISGAGILVGDTEKSLYKMAFGSVTEGQTFELGSLTQALFTSTALMILSTEKHLNLNSTLDKFLPAFGEEGKEKITIKQLLKHTSGLGKTRPYLNSGLSKEETIEKACYEELESPPAFERIYSELGYVVLGALIEKLSEATLDKFLEERLVGPLGLTGTSFKDKGNSLGHTGLISTLEDCHKIVALIGKCHAEKGTLISKPVVDEFVGVKARYKLGWDNEETTQRTIRMISDTGCAVWFDVENGVVIEVFTKGGKIEAVQKWLPLVYAELNRPPV